MSLRRLLQPLLHCSRGLSATFALFLCALIHVVTLIPRQARDEPDQALGSIFHNWLHYPLYAALCLWVLLAMPRAKGALPRTIPAFVWSFAMVLAVGISDEWHQVHSPWRDGDPLDLLTDVLAAAGLLWILRGFLDGRPERSLWLRLALVSAATLASATWAYLAAC